MIIVYVDVFLSLNGTVIPDHGYVAISDIGSSYNTALLCITNRRPPYGRFHSGGDWFPPNGTRVDGTSVPGVTRTRGSMVVRLKRTTGTAQEGIYWCSVLDAASTLQTVYVGLYNTGGGNVLGFFGAHYTGALSILTDRLSRIVRWYDFHSP